MENQISGLESKINEAVEQKEKILLQNQLASALRPVNIVRSLQISNEVIRIAKTISYPEAMADGYMNAGICSRMLSKYDDAFQYFEKALEAYSEINDPMGKAKVINSIGNIYLNLSDYKYSLEYLYKCLEIVSTSDNKKFEASILSNIGLAYQELGDYTSSLENYLKSMQIYTNYNIPIPESLLNNIGIVYQNLGDFTTSLNYFNNSLKLAEEKDNKLNQGFALGNISIVHFEQKQYNDALNYLDKSIKIFRDLGNRQAEANALSNIGKSYRGLEDYEKSIEYQLLALKIQEEISDFSGKASILLLIGEIYFSLANYESAKQYYIEGLKLAQNIGDSINETTAHIYLGALFAKNKNIALALDNLFRALDLAVNRDAKKDMCEIHKFLYEVYRDMPNYDKAFEHQEKHFTIEKEISNIESERKLKSHSIQYQLQNAEKERKIALQEKEIFRLKNVELAEANDNLIKLNEEKNEFMGIAAHDLRNPLSGILSFSRKIRTDINRYDKQQLTEIAYEMELASEKMFDLISKMLDINAIESGRKIFNSSKFSVLSILDSIVSEYKERAEAKKININLSCDDKVIVYADRDALGQILDNLISNAVKFTIPGKDIFIKAYNTGDFARFEVKDGGPGLTEKDKQKLFGRFMRLSAQPTGNEKSTGLGLSIAKKLTNTMGGKIWCESVYNEGANFIVDLPVKNTE